MTKAELKMYRKRNKAIKNMAKLMSVKAIAEQFGISRQRVEQILLKKDGERSVW